MRVLILLSILVLAGCGQVQIRDACDKYQQAVGPEVEAYVMEDGVIDAAEQQILDADAEFKAQIKSEPGPTVPQAKAYSSRVGTPWLLWVDKDAKLDTLSKRLRHATKEDFDRAMQAVETGK